MKNKSSISESDEDEQLQYRVVSVSLPKPKQHDYREDLTISSTPYYARPNSITAKVQQASPSSVPTNTTLNQTLAPCQGTQDASVEARISFDLGKEAMTQTDNDNVPLAEEAEEAKATGEVQIDECSSQKTCDERLKSLSKELAEIRLLFEHACSD